MQTPIADFVKEYTNKKSSRFHMPGHKGQAFLGCEVMDITEVAGADALYEAEGIIDESEKNAAKLFGTKRTVFSTEGSSQCIRAMMHLVIGYWKACQSKKIKTGCEDGKETKVQNVGRPYVLAARNVHKAFLYAAALVDFDVVWLYPKEMHSLCSCNLTAKTLEEELEKQIREHQGVTPAAVYVTSPDYLGGTLEISAIAEVCHNYHTLLAVDNAHGAYLHFLEKPCHPMDLGADICCDSAHKTLPVLTGGAYLQIGKEAPDHLAKNAKHAMALFGSTSPSYLTLASLDSCNAYLENGYREKLKVIIEKLNCLKADFLQKGWKVEDTDPLKVTIATAEKGSGKELAEYLRRENVECEYSDEEYIVFMVTPQNTEEDFTRLCRGLKSFKDSSLAFNPKARLQPVRCHQVCSIREAVFACQEMIEVEACAGRICGTPTVGCPPAIPIVVAGEMINEEAVAVFQYYGINRVSVIEQ